MKNYFRKKKINFCYEFMPGDFQVICGSMVGENRWSPVTTENPGWISCKSDKGDVTLNLMKTSGMRNVLLVQTTNPAHYLAQDDKKAS